MLMTMDTAEHYKTFDPDEFLKTYYSDVNVPDRILFRLESLHRAYQGLPPSGLKVLDFGAGPSIFTVISAASRASEIIMADVAESNRAALRKWLKRDPTAFDWSPYFNHVVQKLEGPQQPDGERAAREREEKVRQVVKEVVRCNISEDPPVQEGFEGPYDVVMDSWCLAYACTTNEMYEKGIAKLVGLLNPGGTLMIFASQRSKPSSYVLGSASFPALAMTEEYVTKVLRQQGLTEVSVTLHGRVDSANPIDLTDPTGYIFVTATKI